MRKVSLVIMVLGLVATAGPASAGIFGDTEAFAPPPTAEQMLRNAGVEVGTPPLYGIGSDDTVTAAEEDASTPFVWFGGTLIYENSVGIGTFVADEDQRRSYWEMLWSLRAKLYLFHKKLFVQARIDLIQPIVDHADAETTENNQFTISDTILTIMSPAIYTEPVTGIRFGAWMDFLFPSSLEAQFTTRQLAWRTGVLIGKTFDIDAIGGGVDLQYQFRFTKNFHESKSPRSMQAYIPGRTDAVGVSTDFGIMNRLIVTLSFLKDFYIGVDFIIYNNWHYDTAGEVGCPEDLAAIDPRCTLRPGTAASPGERGRVDLSLMTLEAGYSPLPYLTIALGVTTYQPAMKDDNSGLRAPLNFEDASRNFTTVYLDIIGTY